MTNELPKVANGPKIIQIRTSNEIKPLCGCMSTCISESCVDMTLSCCYFFVTFYLFLCQNNQCLPSSFLRWNYCSKGEELQGKWLSSQPLVAEAAFEPTTCRSHKWCTRTISSPWDLLSNRGSLRASKLQNELEKHDNITACQWLKIILHIQQVLLTIGSFKMPAGESYPKHASWHV